MPESWECKNCNRILPYITTKWSWGYAGGSNLCLDCAEKYIRSQPPDWHYHLKEIAKDKVKVESGDYAI